MCLSLLTQPCRNKKTSTTATDLTSISKPRTGSRSRVNKARAKPRARAWARANPAMPVKTVKHEDSNVTYISQQQVSREFIKSMITTTIEKCGGFKEFKRFLKDSFTLYLRDTGGQVEFQEMIPLLVFGPSIFFFVFRLDLDFKKKFEVKYRKGAGESINCYISSITTEEAFLQCLASVDAMDTPSVKTHQPLVFIIGTHRDELGE